MDLKDAEGADRKGGIDMHFTAPHNDPGPIMPSELIIYSPVAGKQAFKLSGCLTADPSGYYMPIQLCFTHDVLNFLNYVCGLDSEDFKHSVVWVKDGMWTVLSFPLARLVPEVNVTEGERPRPEWKRTALAQVKDINNRACSLTIWADPENKMYVGCIRED